MNTLSWFIYLINVVPTIGNALLAVGIVSMIGIAITIVGHLIGISGCYSQRDREEFDKQTAPLFQYWRKVFIITTLVTIIPSSLIPSQKTLILIGASEFGEKLVNSEKAKNIFDPSYELLETWIKQELKRIKDGEVKK